MATATLDAPTTTPPPDAPTDNGVPDLDPQPTKMRFKSLVEARNYVAREQATLKRILDRAGPDLEFGKAAEMLECAEDVAADEYTRRINAWKTASTELNEKWLPMERQNREMLQQEARERQKEAAAKAVEMSGGEIYAAREPDPVGFRQWLAGSSVMQMAHGGDVGVNSKTAQFGLSDLMHAATMSRSASGIDPFNRRLPGIAEDWQDIPHIIDLLPRMMTDQEQVLWLKETAWAPAASTIGENPAAGATPAALPAGVPEESLAAAQQSTPVVDLITSIPATKQQLRDVSFANTFVMTRLAQSVRLEIGSQIWTGDGTAPNLVGLTHANWAIPTGAGNFAASPDADASPGDDPIAKAYEWITTCAEGSHLRQYPQAWVMRPSTFRRFYNSYDAERAFRGQAVMQDGPVARLHGLPVIFDMQIGANNILLANFDPTVISYFEREGIEVDSTEYYSQDYLRNIVRFRATGAGALVVFQPTALLYITLTVS